MNTNPMAPTPWDAPPPPLYNHFLWVIGRGESNSSLIKICKLSKTILTTLAPFQHGYRSSVLILHRSFPNVYNLFFTSSKNSYLVSISNLPFGLSYFITRLFRLIYVEPRFENMVYFLQTEDNICNYGIFLVEDNANICFLWIMYAFWGIIRVKDNAIYAFRDNSSLSIRIIRVYL